MKDRNPGAFLVLFCSLIFCVSYSGVVKAQSVPDAATPRTQSATGPQKRQPGDIWVPPDIDAAVPAVDATRPCSLPDVLERTGRKIQEMFRNLDRFTATEVVEHQNVDRSGKLGNVQARNFEYVVSIVPQKTGYMAVNELRGQAKERESLEGVATTGIPSLILILLPVYARDFEMSCDGLGQWQDQPAWQVRFEQRTNRINHMSGLVMGGQRYDIRLRGRAWILADSYQVVHLETDLADTIPQVRLRLEHMGVDYGPVAFPARKTELWLPLRAELYMDLRGRRFYRRHSFRDFTLFSVEVNQQIENKQTE